MDLRKVWEQRAEQWCDWARTPLHDSYWAYSGAFFDGIVPRDAGGEPVPDYEALGRRQWTRAERIPLFLFIRAVKRP